MHFHLDAKQAIKVINNPACNTNTVKQCKESLKQLAAKSCGITFHWVRAHSDCIPNIQADKLAKLGANLTVPNLRLPTAAAEIKKKDRNNTIMKWQNEWSNEGSCQQTRKFIPVINKPETQMLTQLPRDRLSAMVQFITGHNYLKKHLFTTGRATNNVCRLCKNGEESSWHLWNDCSCIDNNCKDMTIKNIETLVASKKVAELMERRERVD